MEGLYPDLHDRVKKEGLCPICLLELESAPRYMCDNAHILCYRCKSFYYACPTCRAPLNKDAPPVSTYDEPTDLMAYPSPSASAPPMDGFHNLEKEAWLPPMDDERKKSRTFPKACKYKPAGCNVRTLPWLLSAHEDECLYKEMYEAMHEITENLDAVTITNEPYDDSEELVACRYRKYGCMVNMPRRRKVIHEGKCNYNKYHEEEDNYSSSSSEGHYDPDEQVECKWAEYGCRVKPKRSRQEIHEEKCNYRMEECAYGCGAVFQPPRKYAHERSCDLAN